MDQLYIPDKTYDKLYFIETPLEQGDYENCKFNNCDFSDANLRNFKFTDCEFTGCNISLAILYMTVFRDVKFKDCKMLGLRFDNCHKFALSFTFDNCSLNHSSFFQTKIKRTVFRNCLLQETDFIECDISHAIFDNCDFLKASFDRTNLEHADFRTAYNYSINPETNRIRKAKFSLYGVSGLLDKYDIVIELKPQND